jgi:OOP family OmpA-OmpF porin
VLKTIAIALFCLVMALGVLGCQKDTERDGQQAGSEDSELSSSSPKEVVPIEVTTTQGSTVLFSGGDISWADSVVSFRSGDPAPKRSADPNAALGKPDYRGIDDARDESTYVSLGHGGELVLALTDNVLVDGEGPDLAIFEIGPEIEPILVAIGEDGQNVMLPVGRVEGSTCTVDIAPYVKPGQRFGFIKLTDAKAGKSNNSDWPGADIDAIGIISTQAFSPAEKDR